MSFGCNRALICKCRNAKCGRLAAGLCCKVSAGTLRKALRAFPKLSLSHPEAWLGWDVKRDIGASKAGLLGMLHLACQECMPGVTRSREGIRLGASRFQSLPANFLASLTGTQRTTLTGTCECKLGPAKARRPCCPGFA